MWLFFWGQQANPSLCLSRVHSRRLHAAEPFFLKNKELVCVTMDRKRRYRDRERKNEETYRLRFTRISSRLNITLRGFTGWSGFATGLLLIPSFVEYHCETFCWCWIIHIPFTKFRQGTTFVLLMI